MWAVQPSLPPSLFPPSSSCCHNPLHIFPVVIFIIIFKHLWDDQLSLNFMLCLDGCLFLFWILCLPVLNKTFDRMAPVHCIVASSILNAEQARLKFGGGFNICCKLHKAPRREVVRSSIGAHAIHPPFLGVIRVAYPRA